MNGIFAWGRTLRALRADLDTLAAGGAEEMAQAAQRIEAVDRRIADLAAAAERTEQTAATRDDLAMLATRVDAQQGDGAASADRLDTLERRLNDQASAIDRLHDAVYARDDVIATLRLELERTRRQAAIDLDEVRATARALAGLLVRAKADAAPPPPGCD